MAKYWANDLMNDPFKITNSFAYGLKSEAKTILDKLQ
jgi:hypothetical protein